MFYIIAKPPGVYTWLWISSAFQCSLEVFVSLEFPRYPTHLSVLISDTNRERRVLSQHRSWHTYPGSHFHFKECAKRKALSSPFLPFSPGLKFYCQLS